MEEVVPYTCTKPKPPRTGFSHPKCYARSLADCCGEITREHYISANALDVIGESFEFVRPQWWGDASKQLTSAALRSFILCKRHNNALSGVDVTGGRLVQAVRSVAKLREGASGRIAVNGFDVERWMLKILCGTMCLDRVDVPELWARILFSFNDLVDGRGLYVNVARGKPFAPEYTPSAMFFEASVNNLQERVRTGCRLTLSGHSLYLSMTGNQHDESEPGKTSIRRPRYFRWEDPNTAARFELAFSWPGVESAPGLDFELVPD